MSDPFKDFINDQLAECVRCQKMCRIAGPSNPDARLLKYATATEVKQDGGLCADCATTQFLRGIETIMYGLENNGVKILLDPRVQKQFGELMAVGKADADPAEVNWQRVVENWDLPFPKKKGKKKKR